MYKKILLINPFGIGDVLFTTPIIHALKETFPSAKIGYLCNRRSSAVLENNPYLDFIFIYERDEFEEMRKKSFLTWLKKIFIFFRQIKKEHFDLALDFSLNLEFGFFSFLAGIKERAGYDFKQRGRFLTKKIPLSGYTNKHIVEYYIQLLKLIGIESGYQKLELYPKERDEESAEKLLSQKMTDKTKLAIGIIPGGGKSWGKGAYLKHWPAEKFAQLADKIIENYQAEIIIMGDFTEKEIAKRIISKMRSKAADFTGETTIGQLAALLKKMSLVISNDGGPLHIATAVDVPSVSIFGPVDEVVYGPYPPSWKHLVVKKEIACRPCYQKFRMPPCQKDRECINSISVEDVFAAVNRLLARSDLKSGS